MSMIFGAITAFRGRYRFLSNFYPAQIRHEGIVYPTAEHAYQASKTDDMRARARVAKLKGPLQAKNAGRGLPLPSDWNSTRRHVMQNIVTKKFAQNPDLVERLLHTGMKHLIEGNEWGDTYWGVTTDGDGLNILGRILMDVREAYR
jgi:ribA/ribD-fused uncharacterized protein